MKDCIEHKPQRATNFLTVLKAIWALHLAESNQTNSKTLVEFCKLLA